MIALAGGSLAGLLCCDGLAADDQREGDADEQPRADDPGDVDEWCVSPGEVSASMAIPPVMSIPSAGMTPWRTNLNPLRRERQKKRMHAALTRK